MIASGISETILPLDQLRINEVGEVVEIVGNASEVHRLSEMGLHHGTRIRVVRRGTPCLLALDGKRLSLRLGGDVDIFVAPE